MLNNKPIYQGLITIHITTLIQITAATGHILIMRITLKGSKRQLQGDFRLAASCGIFQLTIPLSEGHTNYSSRSQFIVKYSIVIITFLWLVVNFLSI